MLHPEMILLNKSALKNFLCAMGILAVGEMAVEYSVRVHVLYDI